MSLSGTTFNCTVSTAGLASTSYVTTQINNLIDSAPGALNTLNELAAAIGDDANYATTITNALAAKAPLASPSLTGTVQINTSPRLKLGSGAELSFGDSTNANFIGITEGTVNQWTDTDKLGIYYRNELKLYSNSNTLQATWDSSGNLANLGTISWTGGSSGNANTAYTHSQAAHAPSNANYITNNNQLSNGAGYTTNTGTTTASNSQTFTNKGGNISQWTNNSGYTTNVGDITGVTAGTGMSGGGTSGAVTLNCSIVNTWRGISDSVSTTSNSVSASQTAVKAAYDRSWPNTQLTDTQVRSKFSGGTNVAIDSSGVISATNTTYSEGDHGLTQANFTDTLRTKLNGIAASANNYSFPYTVSASESASTVVQRNGYGYLHASYFNGSGTFSTTGAASGMARFTGTNGSDTYGRCYNATAARLLLNVADGATNTAAPFYTSAIAVGAGGLTQQNFTTTLKNKLDGIAASATNTAAPFYTSAIAVGAGGLTQQNFTTTLKNKLDGIAAGAQVNTTHTTNTWRSISDSVSTTSSSVSASQTAVKAAYDRSWPDTTYSAGTGMSLSGTTFNCSITQTTDTWRGLGGTSSTGHRGDHGETAYTHSQSAHAPSNANYVNNTNQLTNGNGYITSSQSTMGSLFGGGSSGVTNQGLSRDAAYKIMNNSNSSVACVTTVGGSSNEYLRYASGGNFSWDTIEWNHIQNVSALSALP
jgi:hypothetical protein